MTVNECLPSLQLHSPPDRTRSASCVGVPIGRPLPNRRLRAEFEEAAKLQRALLPTLSPLAEGVRFAWAVEPCSELAGDTLNVLALGDDHLAVYVLDVSGHGLPAAMLAHTVHKFLSPPEDAASILVERGGAPIPPAEVLRRLNQLFPMEPGLEQYFTILYGIVDRDTKRFRFSSAGHCSPILWSAKRGPEEISVNGFPIGFVPDAVYDEHEVGLSPGSRLLLYSDGLTEAESEFLVPFGTTRLMNAFADAADRPIEEMVPSLLAKARAWGTGRGLADDMSVLVLEAT